MIALAFALCLHGSGATHVGYREGEAVELVVRGVPGQDIDGHPLYLQEDAAAAFLELTAFAAREGVELRVNYAFRSYEQQARLRRQSHRLAARPGHSDHQLGISVDIAGTSHRVGRRRWHRTPIWHWLVREGRRFGFVNDVPREPWHFTYRPDLIAPKECA